MIPVPSGVRVWLAVGHTDMRCGMNGLALRVQQAPGRDPYAGDLYVFRGRRGDLVKIVRHDHVPPSKRGVASSSRYAGYQDIARAISSNLGGINPKSSCA